jgi:hypothetical protein
MNIEFKNVSQLLENLIKGKITFEDQESTRFLVNALGEYCASYCGNTFNDFSGYSSADDISDGLNEMLPEWEFDWFDVLTFTFDVEEITHSLLINDSISMYYSFESTMPFVEEHLSSWSDGVKSFIDQSLKG